MATAVAPDLDDLEYQLRESPKRVRRALIVVTGALSFVGLVLLLYAAAIHANGGDSDGASVALEARAIGQGHLLLNGWRLSLDSFWTIDALFYMVAVLLDGLRPALLYAVPALIASLVVVTGVVLAGEGRRGAGAIAGGATVVALLAFPTHAMALFFLRGPLHIGTALWALIAFWCLRKRAFGWGWAAAVAFLAAGALGDLQILVYGIAPVFVAGIFAMLRTRSWRAGIAQVTASIAGLALAEVVRTIAKALGTFRVGTSKPLEYHQIFSNMTHAASAEAELIGLSVKDFGTAGVPSALQDVHYVGALVLIAAFIVALVMLVRDAVTGRQRGDRIEALAALSAPADAASDTLTGTSPWSLDDMLLIAIFGPPLAYGVLTINPKDPEYARYLTAAVIFAVILAGRMVARFVAAFMAHSNTCHVAGALRPRVVGSALAAAGVTVALCFGAGLGYNLSQRDPGQPAAQLASFLYARHLTNGVGSYWNASIVTVESGGKVAVRPVVVDGRNRIVRYPRESADYWYSGRDFQFFVFDLAGPWRSDDTVSAIVTWGKPAHVYAVGSYRVFVWPRLLHIEPYPGT